MCHRKLLVDRACSTMLDSLKRTIFQGCMLSWPRLQGQIKYLVMIVTKDQNARNIQKLFLGSIIFTCHNVLIDFVGLSIPIQILRHGCVSLWFVGSQARRIGLAFVGALWSNATTRCAVRSYALVGSWDDWLTFHPLQFSEGGAILAAEAPVCIPGGGHGAGWCSWHFWVARMVRNGKIRVIDEGFVCLTMNG